MADYIFDSDLRNDIAPGRDTIWQDKDRDNPAFPAGVQRIHPKSGVTETARLLSDWQTYLATIKQSVS